jgi:hypothetical protein
MNYISINLREERGGKRREVGKGRRKEGFLFALLGGGGNLKRCGLGEGNWVTKLGHVRE